MMVIEHFGQRVRYLLYAFSDAGEKYRERCRHDAIEKLRRWEKARSRVLAILAKIESNEPLSLEDWRFVFRRACRTCGGFEFWEADVLDGSAGVGQFPEEPHWTTQRFCCTCDKVRADMNCPLGAVRRIVDQRSPYLTNDEIATLHDHLARAVIFVKAERTV
jgi:hypothetical protein